MDWLANRTQFLCSTGVEEKNAKTQALQEQSIGMDIMSPEYVEVATRPPVLPCVWHPSAKGCKYSNDCRQSHGVPGVAATSETFAERQNRVVFEKANGIPLLNSKNTVKNRVRCRYISKSGGCKNGINCNFSHKATPCKGFFSESGCTNGEICVFSHEKEPCNYFHSKNGCQKGPECKFSHALFGPVAKVKDCMFFPKNCANGPGCAYNLIGETCAPLVD